MIPTKLAPKLYVIKNKGIHVTFNKQIIYTNSTIKNKI